MGCGVSSVGCEVWDVGCEVRGGRWGRGVEGVGVGVGGHCTLYVMFYVSLVQHGNARWDSGNISRVHPKYAPGIPGTHSEHTRVQIRIPHVSGSQKSGRWIPKCAGFRIPKHEPGYISDPGYTFRVHRDSGFRILGSTQVPPACLRPRGPRQVLGPYGRAYEDL